MEREQREELSRGVGEVEGWLSGSPGQLEERELQLSARRVAPVLAS